MVSHTRPEKGGSGVWAESETIIDRLQRRSGWPYVAALSSADTAGLMRCKKQGANGLLFNNELSLFAFGIGAKYVRSL